MENRVRNETAFNKLLDHMEQNSSNYFLSTTSNLRDLYRITNPLYLFSDTFHELILKLLTGIQKKKNFDVRKCARELARELNFYKIANPLKHLKTFDSIPSAVPLPAAPPPAAENKSQSLCSTPTENVTDVSTDLKILSIEVDSDSNKPLETSLVDALKGVPKSVTTVINIVKAQSEPKSFVVDALPCTSDDATSTSKRKIEEVVFIREDEISRKKTSNGLRVNHLRKSPIQARDEIQSKCFRPIAKKSNEPICIIDDDEEDGLVNLEKKNESCLKNSISNDKLSNSKVKSLNETIVSTSLLNKSTEHKLRSVKESVDSCSVDDDVLIIEDLCKLKPSSKPAIARVPKKPAAGKLELPSDQNIVNSKSKNRADDAGDDLIIVENFDFEPTSGEKNQTCKVVRNKGGRQSCNFSDKKQSWTVSYNNNSNAKQQTGRTGCAKESSLGNDEDCIVYVCDSLK